MKIRPLSAAVLLALSSLTLAAHADDVRRPYIVQLVDKPVASYDGAISGLAATKPAPGRRIDIEAPNVQSYTSYLDGKKSVVRASVGNAPVTHTYDVVLNGFAAMLTDAEVRTLMARSDVAAVQPDTPHELATTYTPTFLGLDGAGGVWSQLAANGIELKGEDIIIGIVDGGVWPEHLSYADRVDSNGKPTFDNSGTLAYGAPPARWKGICQEGEGFTTANCNNKLVGAQYFNATFLSVNRPTHWSEFNSSPRDSIGGTLGEGGHGTHTSSTAGGNSLVDTFINTVNVGQMSGMAPRARLSSYKVCWSYNDATQPTGARNTCYAGDNVAAIEQAVKDGVHVINYSISGGLSINDLVEQAFFNASNAGVIAVASAGNDGPGNQVAHVSPWHSTIGASTYDRSLQAEVVLGNGQRYSGASINATPLPSAPLITAEAAAMPGANPTLVTLCYSAASNGGQPVLDPVKVKDKIVICTRGTNARVDKSLAVAEAGGVGMVQVDNGAGLVAEMHSVPTVHVNATKGAAIRSYAIGGGTAAITRFAIGASEQPAPMMAGFSSRGPNRADANVLKPDMTAPGVDIIAAVTPELSPTQRADVINGTLVPPVDFSPMSGTSMSAPHVTGLSALLRQRYPDWSPSMIKSALMTTATDTVPDGINGDTAGRGAFGQGAGHVNPRAALDPGLVYAITESDYRKYMCGAGMAAQCAGGSIAGYNLNLPSISVPNVLGSVDVVRSVTNVSNSTATYTANIGITGFSASVTPSTLTIPAGETRSFTVRLARTSAPAQTWQYGTLTWSGEGRTVRSPVVARAAGQSLAAPEFVSSDRATGNKPMTIYTNFAGKMSAVAGGLKEINRRVFTAPVTDDSTQASLETMRAACASGAPGTVIEQVTVPSGAMVAQFETFDRDTSGQGEDDLDLLVLNANGALVDYSAEAGSNELVRMISPAPGTYRACAFVYSTSDAGPTTFGVSTAVVTTADRGGNFKALVPARVYAGGSATVATSWSGLPSGKRFLGAVRLLDNNNVVGTTTAVQVETNSPLPLAQRGQRGSPKNLSN
ncbi:peptidase S8 and S53 subtilisin kexin sedolisin [Massilia aurea]|uniref:Peptidase S8 and S53 subtilisin kexin sedolisin n=1 Tax=Massilia aurea TaxID=373040 RepID=A0A422QP10_9BURK|nr:S8 family peptidase [Massilia aurea]RNF31572.1 peptidase S8 and S53 subtilisin kexin sedolisin [Massilia aurea]